MTHPTIERAEQALWSAQGRRESLLSRSSALTRVVGIAKARLALREEVERIQEELQRAANGKAVSEYTDLLSALVRDIMSEDDAVELELYTDRGSPALDVFHKTSTGRVDVFRGAGGSITNVICLGLRAIATAKSGQRRFFALDEPDCWIRPHGVPRFYSVVKQLADQGGFQTLVVSHHDVSLFDAGVNIIKLTGNPRDGLVVNTRSGSEGWENDEVPGIRAIRLQNFAGFIDVSIPLAPGVNAIIGEHNIGKSHILQFLRAISYGGREECSDADIRHGERSYSGTVFLERGLALQFTRDPRKTPVNHWRLLDRAGNVVTLPDGTYCDSGKRRTDAVRGDESRALPAWVPDVLGISRRDGLDIQLQMQKEPVFLLDKSAVQRATVLSVGQESGTLASMQTLHRAQIRDDNAAVKSGEQEMASIVADLEALDAVLPELADSIAAAKRAQSEREVVQAKSASLSATVTKLEHLQASAERAEQVAELLAALPAIPDIKSGIDRIERITASIGTLERCDARLRRHAQLSDAFAGLPPPPTLVNLKPLHEAISRIEVADAAIRRHEAVTEALSGLPTVPELNGIERIAAIDRSIANIVRTNQALEQHGLDLKGLEDKQQQASKAIQECLDAVGNRCPTCRQGVTHEHLIGEGAVA